MKSRNIYICVAVAFLSLNSCTDSWLEPKPLSFHTPEDTYVGVDGFEATLSACEAEMHDEYNGDGCAILTEMICLWTIWIILVSDGIGHMVTKPLNLQI